MHLNRCDYIGTDAWHAEKEYEGPTKNSQASLNHGMMQSDLVLPHGTKQLEFNPRYSRVLVSGDALCWLDAPRWECNRHSFDQGFLTDRIALTKLISNHRPLIGSGVQITRHQ